MVSDAGVPDLDWTPEFRPVDWVAFVDHDGDVIRLWRDAETVVLSAQAVHIPLSEVAGLLSWIAEYTR
jgi:hypothetical protein